MEDDDLDINLPRQECLGASAADVEGVIVPDAPTSSSNEGLTGVSTAGTLEEYATVEEEEVFSPGKDVRTIDDVLRDINTGYESVASPVEKADDSFDAEKDTFFGDSPGVLLDKGEEMETAQKEVLSKKRKADTSPLLGTSGEEDAVTHQYSLRGNRRRNRFVESSKEEEKIEAMIDLTEGDYETPNGSDLERSSDVNIKKGGTSSTPFRETRVAYTPEKKRKTALTRTKIDFKDDLNDITLEQLLSMSATRAGIVGIECIDVMDAIRIHSRSFQGSWSKRMKRKFDKTKKVILTLTHKAESSGDPPYLEARVKTLSAELSSTEEKLQRKEVEFDELKRVNEDLRKEILEMKHKMGKVCGIEKENVALWKEVKELKEELLNLKKDRRNDGAKKTDKRRKVSSPGDSLTVRRDISPVAGPSWGLVAGSSKDNGSLVISVPVNKEVISEHSSNKIEQTNKKSVGGDDSLESSRMTMDWEALPQRPLKAAMPRVIGNVQLVPSRERRLLVRRRRRRGKALWLKQRGCKTNKLRNVNPRRMRSGIWYLIKHLKTKKLDPMWLVRVPKPRSSKKKRGSV